MISTYGISNHNDKARQHKQHKDTENNQQSLRIGKGGY